MGVLRNELVIHETLIDEDMHQAQGQGRVRAGFDHQVPVRAAGGPVAIRIDGHDPGAVFSRPGEKGPGMEIGRQGVAAPDHDQVGMNGALDIGAGHIPEAGGKTLVRRRAADGSQQFRRPQFVEKCMTAMEIHQAHGAGVGVRQDGFGAELIDDRLVATRDFPQRPVPGNPLKPPGSLGAGPFQRMQDTQGGGQALRVILHLDTDRSPGERMFRVPGHGNDPAVFHADHQAAGIRTVMGTYGALFDHGSPSSDFDRRRRVDAFGRRDFRRRARRHVGYILDTRCQYS